MSLVSLGGHLLKTSTSHLSKSCADLEPGLCECLDDGIQPMPTLALTVTGSLTATPFYTDSTRTVVACSAPTPPSIEGTYLQYCETVATIVAWTWTYVCEYDGSSIWYWTAVRLYYPDNLEGQGVTSGAVSFPTGFTPVDASGLFTGIHESKYQVNLFNSRPLQECPSSLVLWDSGHIAPWPGARGGFGLGGLSLVVTI